MIWANSLAEKRIPSALPFQRASEILCVFEIQTIMRPGRQTGAFGVDGAYVGLLGERNAVRRGFGHRSADSIGDRGLPILIPFSSACLELLCSNTSPHRYVVVS